MPPAEKYPCYISIQDDVTGVSVELPSEKDGTMLLSTIASQFPGAIGLRFKSETGSWRGVQLSEDDIFDIPFDGWGSVDYQIVMPDRALPTGSKRKIQQEVMDRNKEAAVEDAEDEVEDEDKEEELPPLEMMKQMTEPEILSDLVIMNVPYESNEAEIKAHFKTFGELEFCELKQERGAPKHRGFGFIRYKTVGAVEKCLTAKHILHEREIDVAFPKDKSKDDGTPTKLFIGRLPKDLTEQEMQEYFEKFGDLKECYIPNPFRGFGFVSFKRQSAARKVLKSTHVLKGQYLNVSLPARNSKGDNMRGGGFGGLGAGFGGRGGGFNLGGDFGSRGGFSGFGGMGGPMMAGMQGMLSGGMAQRGGFRGQNGFQNSRNFGPNSFGSNRR